MFTKLGVFIDEKVFREASDAVGDGPKD